MATMFSNPSNSLSDGNTVNNSGPLLQFRGARNLAAVLDVLAESYGLRDATEVVVTGDSAGGLATILHVDAIAQRLGPDVKVQVTQVSRLKAAGAH